MAFPTEHACIFNPEKRGRNVSTIRQTRHAEEPPKDYDVVMQRENDDSPLEDISFRYDSEDWTEDQARDHCEVHGGTFQPATGDVRAEQPAPEPEPAESEEEDDGSAIQVADSGPLSIDPNHVIHSAECFQSYMGIWAMEPTVFRECVQAIREGTLQPIAMAIKAEAVDAQSNSQDKPFELANPTTAMIRIEGTMMKASSKFGGTSTVRTRRSLRAAAADPEIDQIVMVWDTPGGHVSGTKELADDIDHVNRTIKPVHSYVNDLCASAGLECASQSGSVSANEPARIGSFGTFGVIRDVSKAARIEGIEDTVISTGQYKGYAPGRSVRGAEKHAAAIEIADLQRGFDAQMARGRSLDRKQIEELRTGEVWIAKKAKARGLIDKIESFDAFIDRITSGANRTRRTRRATVRAQVQREKLNEKD